VWLLSYGRAESSLFKTDEEKGIKAKFLSSEKKVMTTTA
jgi:hypothetical protein